MFDTLTLDTDSRGVATLSLNRPEKHNAMSGPMLDDLSAAAARIASDPGIRVVVLTGVGKSFCAGGDLTWMQMQMAAGSDRRAEEARKLANMLSALDSLPQPVIGRVQGNAFGGGVGMASVCDVAIGAESVKMGFTETRLGIIPATIGPYVVARMGAARARRVFMSARIFEAEEAQELGLLARVVSAEALDAAVEAEVAPYLQCAPGAVAEAKALVRRLGPRLDTEVIDHTISALVRRWESEEAAEGIAAFFDKRKAAWMPD